MRRLFCVLLVLFAVLVPIAAHASGAAPVQRQVRPRPITCRWVIHWQWVPTDGGPPTNSAAAGYNQGYADQLLKLAQRWGRRTAPSGQAGLWR